MRIDKIHLKNVGPHRDLQVEFNSGLIGLLGQNGAGKSTLVNSIYAALTNDFSRFSVVKTDIVNNVADKKENSYIALDGSHRGQTFHLKRWLRPNKNELTLSGNTYYKATEVNQAIEEQLGISKLIIDKYVFVNQWDMFQFIDQTESERAKIFQYLCGTEHASRIYATCSNFVTQRKNVEVIDNSFELETSIKELESKIKGYAKRRKELKALMLSPEKLNSAISTVNHYEEADKLANRLDELVSQLKTVEAKHSKVSKKIKRFGADLAAKTNEKNILVSTPEYVAALDYASNKEIAEKKTRQLNELKAEVTEIESSLSRLQLPVKPEGYFDVDESSPKADRLAELKILFKGNWTILDHFESKHEASCPLCQQAVPAAYVAKVKEQQKGIEVELDALVETFASCRQYKKEKTAYQEEKMQLGFKLEKLQEKIEHISSSFPQLETKSEKEVNALLEKKVELEEEIKELTSTLSEAKGRKEKYGGISSTLKENIERYRTLLDNVPTTEKVEEASQQVEQQRAVEKDYNSVVGAHKEAKQNHSVVEEALANLRSKLEDRAKIQNLLDVVDKAGSVFHWNSLPKTVAQANLQLMVNDINENLALFNNPFYVEADSDLTFKVFFPGKPFVKAKQLSGGQKVVLAIAFRAAIDQVFGHNVGMMFLDEPTAGLDSDNVDYFHAALQQLAKKVSGDRQLVVITHVKELSNVFDQLISV